MDDWVRLSAKRALVVIPGTPPPRSTTENLWRGAAMPRHCFASQEGSRATPKAVLLRCTSRYSRAHACSTDGELPGSVVPRCIL